MSNNGKKKVKNYSPLRYPGGKGKLYPFVAKMVGKINKKNKVYIEPFAGGSGIALFLLFNGEVDEIVINDYDKAIYSMWRAILTQTDEFLKLLEDTEITVSEWQRQKDIYKNNNKKYSLELGFATFFLNRTNRSGILSAGPIGGFEQKGNYKIDVRFNKKDLANRIRLIAKKKNKIHIYNHDVRTFIKSFLPKYEDRAIVYFDPPYYNKGKQLYKNFFTDKDHKEIYELICGLKCPWIVTYDNTDEIKSIYSKYSCWYFDLMYGVANGGKHSEVFYISNEKLLPDLSGKEAKKIHFRKNY